MNPLNDIIPAKFRKYVYAAIALAAIVIACWTASNGDWTAFVGSLIVALSHATAASNVSSPPAETADVFDEPRNQMGEEGNADITLALLIAAVLGVVLLLFGIRF